MTPVQYEHRVRALERGLHLLAVLNQYNGLSMPDLTGRTGLTRSAVYRILATLIEADYVFKSPSDGLYRVTAKVRDLSSGYAPDPWIKSVAAPILDKASAELAWPLSIVVLRNNQLLTVHNTDRDSPLIVRRISAGTTIPVSGTASGLVFLSFGEPELAAALKQSMMYMEQSLLEQEKIDIDLLDKRIRQSQQNGYCVFHGSGYSSLAVPVYRSGVLYAAISIRSAVEGSWPEEDNNVFLDVLKTLADELEQAF